MKKSSDQEAFIVELGRNIRRERTSREITQEKLAELANLNIRTVQKIEAGKLNILCTTLVRLQKAIGCQWEDLLG